MAESNQGRLFPPALAAAIQEGVGSQAELARRAEMPVSRVNDYLGGRYTHIKAGTLERLCRAATQSDDARQDLLKAYAVDLILELPPEAQRLLRFEGSLWPDASSLVGVPAAAGGNAELQAALDRLAALAGASPAARRLITRWVKLVERTMKATAAARR